MSTPSGTSMRTTRRRVSGLGSARSGTEHFWMQRVTALANIPLLLVFLGILIAVAGSSYEEAHALLGRPIVAIVMALALISVTNHMRIGMQVVIEDYVHAEGAKVVALIANIFFCVAVGLAGVFAVLKIGFGG